MTNNAFIDYLNSTNNISGDATGSLAEKQVKLPYFQDVKVQRKLGSVIAEQVTSGHHQAFLLTGHAGDGKTSILAQILQELGRLNTVEGLAVERDYPNFYYSKDMSEIPVHCQTDVLKKALEAPSNGKTSVLITNTGPLLKSMIALAKEEIEKTGQIFSVQNEVEIHSKLLKQLDENKEEPLEIAGYSFHLINIARMDNVDFATEILKKILNPKLWSPCASCGKQTVCPMYLNFQQVSEYLPQVTFFVKQYYRYLFECDKRMTIRQMMGHLSFALTGNLTCQQIHHTPSLKQPGFSHNFANLFFGQVGLGDGQKGKRKAHIPETTQIKGIAQIQNLKLDSIALKEDYHLFVRQDTSYFPRNIAEELTKYQITLKAQFPQQADNSKAHELSRSKERGFRQATRRFFLCYHKSEEVSGQEAVANQIYGGFYSHYCNLISAPAKTLDLTRLRALIFNALYIRNTGFIPNSNQQKLYLTLRRDGNSYQNVMLILGEVDRHQLEVVQIPLSSRYSDNDTRQQLVLRFENTDFPLNYPLIAYFYQLTQGAIFCDNNPSLTHGIASLDAKLMEVFGKRQEGKKEDSTINVFYQTRNGHETMPLSLESDQLTFH
ncbi:MAG: hypothetical protein R3Y63_06850 [Eubacteriales bacterium]